MTNFDAIIGEKVETINAEKTRNFINESNESEHLLLAYFCSTISKAVYKKIGDVGTCVSQYYLKLDGKKLVPQPAQGSITCDKVFAECEKFLQEYGIANHRISTNYGYMD